MTTFREKLTNYLIGIENALQVSLPDFEIVNQKSAKNPEHQIVFDKTPGDEVGMRILSLMGTGTVKYTDSNGRPVTEKNADLIAARVGRKETVVPVFMVKQQNPNWAWLEDGDTRIPFSQIQRTAEHCESLYQNTQGAVAAAAPAR
jgi:hypothetical protein